jgi:hypothetical protein
MIGFNGRKRRFNLYHLEENELYTKDCLAIFIYIDPTTKEEK